MNFDLLETESTTATTGHNSKYELISSMITSIVSSLDVIKEEKTNIKELLDDLEANHGIKKKTAKKAAECIQDPDKLAKLTEAREFLDGLEELISKIKKV